MEPFTLTTKARAAAYAVRTANPIAPEDLMPGRYVALLRELREYIRGGSCDVPTPLYTERIELLPDQDAIAPMKIVSTCLPFVLVQKADGTCTTLDVRSAKLGELDQRYGRLAFRRLKGRDTSETEGGAKKKKGKNKGRKRS